MGELLLLTSAMEKVWPGSANASTASKTPPPQPFDAEAEAKAEACSSNHDHHPALLESTTVDVWGQAELHKEYNGQQQQQHNNNFSNRQA